MKSCCQLLVCAMFIGVCDYAVADSAEAVRQSVDVTEKKYRRVVAQSASTLTTVFDQQIARLNKGGESGDLTDVLQKEKADFSTNKKLPTSPAMKAAAERYVRTVTFATAQLNRAYTIAINRYERLKNAKGVEQIRAKQQQLNAPAVGHTDRTNQNSKPATADPSAEKVNANESVKLNEAVLAYAKSKQKTKDGNGQCWTLADQALAAAGARRPARAGYLTYVFGRKLSKEDAIKPGDIVQFEKVKFKNGNKMPHHTAIVAAVRGQTISILHQNWGGDQIVKPLEFNLATRTQGTIEFFRPQFKPQK